MRIRNPRLAMAWCLLALAATWMPPRARAQEAAPQAAEPAPPAAEPPPPAAEPAPPPPPPTDPGPGIVTGSVRWIPYGQLKIRDELFSNYPNDPGVHDNSLVTRARFGMTAQWEGVEIVLQMQDVRAFGGFPPGQNDGSSFAVFQGYAGVHGDLGYARAGRQVVNYGDQRMIGALDWSMPGRSFDGLRLHGAKGKLELDLFGAVTQLQGPVTDGTTTERSKGSYLAAAYGTWHASSAFNLDTYVLYRHDGPSNANLTLNDDIFAIGGRATGAVGLGGGQLGYTAEVTGEVGSTSAPGPADFSAWAFSGDVRLRMAGSWNPTLTGGFAVASGASGSTNEFNNFYPTNHKFYGQMDLIGLRNLIEGHVKLAIDVPDQPVNFYVQALQLALQTSDGRWSNAGGVQYAPGLAGASRNLGTELDVLVNYKPWPAIALQGGYGLFVPQSGAEDRGFREVSHFAYLQLILATP